MPRDIFQTAIKMNIKLSQTADAAGFAGHTLACLCSPLAASEHMMNDAAAAQISTKTKSLQTEGEETEYTQEDCFYVRQLKCRQK